jgi:hypothetical protein
VPRLRAGRPGELALLCSLRLASRRSRKRVLQPLSSIAMREALLDRY